MNKHASALAKLGKGKPKHFSPKTIEVLKQRLAKARKKRWPKK
jgi:hypothetical protein